ncbi:MAG: alanine--tRNA ligase [Acidobacteriia bacterium]|nr:alanine--tRNA ligase [Terriglobia bacterium]
MTSSEIRSRFLKFFEERSHRVVRSSSLVPANDPTLLFTNAGMNQFKDVFLGRERRDYTRACSSQKCVRAGGKHNDLEQVGRTTRHHTFFEMLGNFSFGDYFKKEAIPWAWELVTKDFAIPREKLYVTVFREDDEAEEIWATSVGVPRARIFRFDEKDNFWAMGDTGPCGPCSEIHYDLGPKASDLGHTDCAFPCDCGRYVELWNLVFMQFNRDEQGNMTPLPRPSIDTGAGLERFCTVLQGKVSNFDTDLFRPLIKEAADLANVEYGTSHDTDVSLRIIADHARAAAFLISDGVLPSNEGRGYVLRLILRRALYHGQTLGLNEQFLYKLAGEVVAMMKDAYPALIETEHHVAKAIKIEEDRYKQTTQVGVRELHLTRPHLSDDALEIYKTTPITFSGPLGVDSALSLFANRPTFEIWTMVCSRRQNDAHIRKMVTSGSAGVVPGPELFRLHDTFGLRPDFVEDIVKNCGLTVDREGYEAEMQKQRERARASWKATTQQTVSPAYLNLPGTVFEGYETLRSKGCIVRGIFKLDAPALRELEPGEEGEVILDRTPFYAESGGQVGDAGWLYDSDGKTVLADVHGCTKLLGTHFHKVRARRHVEVSDLVNPVVNQELRISTMRNHTATHLLHAALRHTLGTHVKQAGSLVAPDRVRFDFTHYAALDPQDLLDIEDLVNERILANEVVETQELELDAAVNSGAMALFGEKYADKVRVLSINDFSRELCGGTHVSRTGDIGLFKIVSESSVAAGTRRIEAVTGAGVLKHLREASATLALLAEALRAKPDELLQAVEKLTESEKRLRKQLESQQRKQAAAQAGDLVENAVEVKGVRVVAARVEAADRAAMRQMVDNLRPRLGSGVIVLGSVADEKVSLVAAVSKDLTDRLDAGKIAKAAAVIVEGTGGGRKDLAEAGGKNPAKLEEALQAVPSIIERML